MAGWMKLEVPKKYLGERVESGNSFVTTYQVEVLLPKGSAYAGYCFLHPAKLVQELNGGFAGIVYNSSFTFTLIKKDREPGKRYKRYKLTAAEIWAAYEPEVAKLKERAEKKELARLAQVGTVSVVACWQGWNAKNYNMDFLFEYNGKCYYSNGSVFRNEKAVRWSRDVSKSIKRGAFEAAREQLMVLRDEYGILQNVRYALDQDEGKATGQKPLVNNSFRALCEKLEKELCRKAADIVLNA